MENKAIEARDIGSDPLRDNDLMDAVRRVRIERAEKSAIASDLRAAEYTRLELLKNGLAPILAQLPRDAELFNHGLIAGDRPRFYVDMIAFVEMSRDRLTYRFLMDTPIGRQMLGESEDLMIMLNAITNYLAQRLVEREFAIQNALVFNSNSTKTSSHTMELEHSSSITAMPVITEINRTNSSQLFIAFVLGISTGIAAIYAGVHWDTIILPELNRLLELVSNR